MSVLQTYLDNLSAKLKAYNEAKATYDKYIIDTAGAQQWYDHLVSIAAWNTHPVEWQASKNEFEGAIVPQRKILLNAVNVAKANYETAKKEYEEAKTTLATPAEIAAIDKEAEIKLLQAQSTANAQKSSTELSTYKEKTTLYFMIAGGVLLFIVIGVYAYKAFKKGSFKLA